MKIAVVGGTGSFGQAFVKKYHQEHELTVISRDETKQHQMRLEYPNAKYIIADVRDRDRIFEVIQGFDGIFHAAALKQVPSCEFFPLEAVKTNILGTNNVLDASRGTKVVCLSTDKAVYPINAMGISKAMMERVASSKGAVITRYGNVMKSRGSIIPIWEEASKRGEPLNITNPEMTRFLMSLDESIDLVMHAMTQGKVGEVYVRKAPAAKMIDLANAIKQMHNSTSPIKTIGVRHGEKMHETLVSEEEMYRAEDIGDYYCIKPDTRDMNYNQYFTQGDIKTAQSFTSENTKRLDVESIKALLGTLST